MFQSGGRYIYENVTEDTSVRSMHEAGRTRARGNVCLRNGLQFTEALPPREGS